MKRIFFEQSEPSWSSGVPTVLALSAMLAVVGCGRARQDSSVSAKSNPALAALMADGPLPTGMTGRAPSVVPPRFCGNGSPPPIDDDGGVSIGTGGNGGVSMGSAGKGGGVSTAPRGNGSVAITGPAGVGLPPPVSSDGGIAGDGGFAGSGGSTGSCEGVPIGFWRFDDCNAQRTDLQDSSGGNFKSFDSQGHTAYRNVDLTCTAGQEGQAVAFAKTGDLVYAPDQPDFGLDAGVTVAAWVKPDRVDGVRTIFRKRDDLNSAFALVINNKKFQFVIRLASGRLATVSTAAQAGQWTHVAGTYDGTYLRLYINGKEASETKAPGTIAKGVGPLMMGNDVAGRRLQGLMDNAWFNSLAAPDAIIMELTCLHRLPTLAVSPTSGLATEPGMSVAYQLSITNRNSASCPPAFFQSEPQTPQDFNHDPFFAGTRPVPSGDSASLSFDITSGEDTEPGTYPLTFFVIQGNDFSNIAQIPADYVLAEPTGCHVTSRRELTIRDVSVVDDPVRTSLNGPATNPSTGAWTFGRMMERLAPTAADAPDVTEAMFKSFLTPQTINGFLVEARPAMDSVVLQPWPRGPGGKLDLAKAPMRLLAIVNRLDLKDLAKGKAGEGRIVYGVLDPSGNQMQFTVILEYLLPATNEAEFKVWADAFHGLQALPFPSEQYNAALQALTDRFTARGAIASNPNGSALIDIRTNEIALSFQWQLREFHLSPTTGFMFPATLFLTPDASFNFTDTLARFINTNEAAIVAETHEVPASFEDAPFQAGAVFNNIDLWSAPGINNPEARHKFSLNTCNGCHGAETNTGFLQINPRDPGQASQLSAFLTGETVQDPETGQSRRLAELARRRQLLESIVCPPAQP
jgi:hypothetical protein